MSRVPVVALLLVASLRAAQAAEPPAEVPPPPDLSSRSDGSDWPSFLGPGRDATSAETGIRTEWPLPIVWQTAIGEGYSAPSVARGRIYVFDREGDTARLRALKSETGEALWRSEYPTRYEDMYGYSGGPRSAPVVDGGRVYTLGVEGRLRCSRAADGALLWEVDTEERYGVKQNFFGVGSTPLVDGDLLIVPVGGSPPGSPGIKSGKAKADGTAIVAFDKRTGKERYRLGDDLASYSSPIIADDLGGRRLGLYFARGGLLAFEPAKGTVAFHFPWRAELLESVNAATPVLIDGGRVFLTETYGPGAVLLQVPEAGDPEIVWRDQRRDTSLRCHWSTPVYRDGYLYGSSGRGSGDAELRCVDAATGAVRWSKPGLGRATLLLVDGHLVVLGERGALHLVRADPARYRPVAEMTLERDDGSPLLAYPAWNAPVLAHGLLYVRGKDRLVALELIPPSTASSSSSPGSTAGAASTISRSASSRREAGGRRR